MILAVACFLLAGVFLALYFFKKEPTILSKPQQRKEQKIENTKINYGLLRIFFGSQTGTAAKFSQLFAEQAQQNGFQTQIIDLKDFSSSHFSSPNQISIFFLSNTGEGQPPTNCLSFMNVLRDKEQLPQEIIWTNISYTVFALGNTQYEYFNRTGKDADRLLQKKGAKRIYQLGIGDDNADIENDFSIWKTNIWSSLQQFRTNNPLQNIKKQIISKPKPDLVQSVHAKYKILFKEGQPFNQEDLDFKTKGSLEFKEVKVVSIKQIRQNTKDGSTLEINMEGEKQYQTAGNLAVYPKNDMTIINGIIDYFHLTKDQLDSPVSILKLDQKARLRLNFIPNTTLINILLQSVDLQAKVTKSTLKKLAQFKSKDPQYFKMNSQPKSTQQYKRISQGKQQFYYLFKLIFLYKIQITLQDFFQLSQSMAPRLYTMASYCNHSPLLTIAVSLTPNGLASKYFQSRPTELKIQLKKSSFTDAMKWKKVIFVAAGTGLAPFRAYLQQKEYLMKKQIATPFVSLYFGCKHADGDFIYKEQLLGWEEKKVIDKSQYAFSRDSQKKVYVQDLLKNNQEEIRQFLMSEDQAMFMCGSLPMGHAVTQLLTVLTNEEEVKNMVQKERLVKQLW